MSELEDLIQLQSEVKGLVAEQAAKGTGQSAADEANAAQVGFGDLPENVPRPGGLPGVHDITPPGLMDTATETAKGIYRDAGELGAAAGGLKGFQMGSKVGFNPLSRMINGIIGGMAGAAGGFAGVEGVKTGLNVAAPDTFPKGLAGEELYKAAARQALYDGGGSVLGEGLRGAGIIAKQLARGSMGVKKGGQEAAETAQSEFGVGLTPMDVSDWTGLGFLHRGIGQLPMVGSGFNRSYLAKGDELKNAWSGIIRRLGPVEDAAVLGYKVNDLISKRFSFVSEEIGKKYEEFDKFATKVKANVDGGQLQRVASQTLGMMQKYKDPKLVRMDSKNKVVRFLYDRPGAVNGPVSYFQYQGMLSEMQKFIDTTKDKKLRSILTASLTDMKKVMDTIDNPQAKEMLKHADAYMTSVLRPFETATSKKFNQFVRKRFKRGGREIDVSGSKEVDEVADLALIKGPDSVKAFKHLLQDPDMIHQYAGYKLEQIFNKAMAKGSEVTGQLALKGSDTLASPGGVDMRYVRSQLGLHDKRGLKYAAWKEMLRETSAPIEKVERLIDLSETAMRFAPRDVSAYIGRRAGIGGMGAVLSLIGGAGAAHTASTGQMGLIAGISATLVMRNMVNVATSRNLMRAAEVALDPKKPTPMRQAAARLIVRTYMGPVSDEAQAQNQTIPQPELTQQPQ